MASSTIFVTLVWLNLGLNTGLSDHWRTHYSLDQWPGKCSGLMMIKITINTSTLRREKCYCWIDEKAKKWICSCVLSQKAVVNILPERRVDMLLSKLTFLTWYGSSGGQVCRATMRLRHSWIGHAWVINKLISQVFEDVLTLYCLEELCKRTLAPQIPKELIDRVFLCSRLVKNMFECFWFYELFFSKCINFLYHESWRF